MGDIKKIRKKYAKPIHPWNKQRIDDERRFKRTYGLVNKKELWKAESILKGFKDQIKSFPSMEESQAAVQRDLLRARLMKLGLVKADTPLGDVLAYTTEQILERRLQTIIQNKGYARTSKQARQMIVHEHILVGEKKINSPSYLVTQEEESQIVFDTRSPFFSEQHPERVTEQKARKAPPKKEVAAEDQPEVVELGEEDLLNE
jgi:small subunit ribosomal protein S4